MRWRKQSEGGVAGPAVLPNLIICRTNSLLKMNGHPYIEPMGDNGRWGLFGSERRAPFRLLIELIWTRLSNQFGQIFPMDDSLWEESLARLLDGTPVAVDGNLQRELRSTAIGNPKADAPAPEQPPGAAQ